MLRVSCVVCQRCVVCRVSCVVWRKACGVWRVSGGLSRRGVYLSAVLRIFSLCWRAVPFVLVLTKCVGVFVPVGMCWRVCVAVCAAHDEPLGGTRCDDAQDKVPLHQRELFRLQPPQAPVSLSNRSVSPPPHPLSMVALLPRGILGCWDSNVCVGHLS
jgi:hypothetical protein